MVQADEPVIAGAALDALIEEKIFGRRWELVPRVMINEEWREIPTWVDPYETPEEMGAGSWAGQTPPRYSVEIATAWRIVERMQHEGYNVMIDADGGMDKDTRVELVGGDGRVFYMAQDLSPAFAICKAALDWAKRKKESR